MINHIPFIFLSGDTHPRLAMHRGAKHDRKGELVSAPLPVMAMPYVETLALLTKVLFPIRQ